MEELKILGEFISGLNMSEKQAKIINNMMIEINSVFNDINRRNNEVEGIINGIDDPRLYVNYFNRAINILILLGLDLEELRLDWVFLTDEFLSFLKKQNVDRRNMTIEKLQNIGKLYELYKFENEKEPENIDVLRDLYNQINIKK